MTGLSAVRSCHVIEVYTDDDFGKPADRGDLTFTSVVADDGIT